MEWARNFKPFQMAQLMMGQWANGFMNGEGTFTWSDGKQKSGIWKNGKLQE